MAGVDPGAGRHDVGNAAADGHLGTGARPRPQDVPLGHLVRALGAVPIGRQPDRMQRCHRLGFITTEHIGDDDLWAAADDDRDDVTGKEVGAGFRPLT